MPTDDALARLRAAKERADSDEQTKANYDAYLADRVANGGWTNADFAEYRREANRIMDEGTEEEKTAAREFWASKAAEIGPEVGAHNRICARIAQERRAA
jgi:hypothetical protein